MNLTDWDGYGTESGNPKCANCMVSCGYEPTAVDHGFGSLNGFLGMVKATLFNKYEDRGALDLLNRPLSAGPSLVQISEPVKEVEEMRA
jgi:hypothetical protein